MTSATLSALIVTPLAGGVGAWLAGRWSGAAARGVALATALATSGLSLWLWVAMRPAIAASGGPALQQRIPWIPRLGVDYHPALDGLNVWFVMLTGFLGCVAVAVSWREIERSAGLHYLCLLAALSGIMGVFLAFDLFLFYFFWELMLVPMYFLIGVWGHEDRIRAAVKFVVFTMASSLFLLISIIGLYLAHEQTTGILTTNYLALIGTPLTPATGGWLFVGFFVAFAVKLPVFPLHTWLPDAHTQAPTAGSVLLAGLLLKTGGYGLIRLAVPLFPEAAAALAAPIGAIGVVGIVYGALLAYGQTDMKRLIAYSSVSHMGFVVLGIATWSVTALQGAVALMLAHGLATGALFAIAGMVHERLHSRSFERLGGLWPRLPKLSSFALFFVLASVGVPGMGNFIGELLTLYGSFVVSPGLVAVAVFGIVLGTVAMLHMMQRVFYGTPRSEEPVSDIGLRETIVLVALALLTIALGLLPQPALESVRLPLAQSVTREVPFDPADPAPPSTTRRSVAQRAARASSGATSP